MPVAGGDEVQAALIPRASAPLQEWSTSELAARCIGEDAEGLATRLVTNSVNGEDFAAMTYETFVNDLHFTPFAARKLDALRTKFMQA